MDNNTTPDRRILVSTTIPLEVTLNLTTGEVESAVVMDEFLDSLNDNNCNYYCPDSDEEITLTEDDRYVLSELWENPTWPAWQFGY